MARRARTGARGPRAIRVNTGDIWVYELASRAITCVTNDGRSYRSA